MLCYSLICLYARGMEVGGEGGGAGVGEGVGGDARQSPWCRLIDSTEMLHLLFRRATPVDKLIKCL